MTTALSKPAQALLSDIIDELLAGYQRPKDLIGKMAYLSNSLKRWYNAPYNNNEQTTIYHLII